MSKPVAIYVRVSSDQQSTKSQTPDLNRWAESQDERVKWYEDKFTGKTMDRPGWKQLEADFRAGKIAKIVVWKLDRLGRTVSGLSTLFDELTRSRITLISITDGIDLSTSAGRLMANVIASVAQYETEIRAERVKAGQEIARANGKTWGGSKKGVRKKITPEKEEAIKAMRANGVSVTKIAKAFSVTRPTIYDVLG